MERANGSPSEHDDNLSADLYRQLNNLESRADGLSGRFEDMKRRSIKRLGEICGVDAISALIENRESTIKGFRNPETQLRSAALFIFEFYWGIVHDRVDDVIALALCDSDLDVRVMAIRLLGKYYRTYKIPSALTTLEDIAGESCEKEELRALAKNELSLSRRSR